MNKCSKAKNLLRADAIDANNFYKGTEAIQVAKVFHEAIAEVDTLEAENKRLRKAIKLALRWNSNLPKTDTAVWRFDKEMVSNLQQALEGDV